MATDSKQASVLFARFIWEAVEKEVNSATATRTIINALRRFQMVLKDAPPGSSLGKSIKLDDLVALRTMVSTDKTKLVTADLEKMFSDVEATLASLNKAGEGAAAGGDLGDGSQGEPSPGSRRGRRTRRASSNEASMAAFAAAATSEPVDVAGYAPIRTMLLALNPRLGGQSPVHKLKDHPELLRIVNEYVHPMVFSKTYRLGKRLGVGGHSTVRKATHYYRYRGKTMAVKHIQKREDSTFEIEMLRREAQILRGVHHAHIPIVYDYIEEPSPSGSCYLILPMFHGGDMLERILKKSGHHFDEDTAVNLILDITKTMVYLHSVGVVHRDIKPENIIFETEEDTSGMQLIDFGFAASGVVGQSLTTACGTPQYAAPEILNGVPHGKEVDCWSLGVVTYVLLCGFPPFYHEDEQVLFRQIKSGRFEFPTPHWDPITESAKDFICKLLVVDPEKRMTMDEAKQHSWLGPRRRSTIHLPLVHSEVKKFRSRERWNTAMGTPATAAEDAAAAAAMSATVGAVTSPTGSAETTPTGSAVSTVSSSNGSNAPATGGQVRAGSLDVPMPPTAAAIPADGSDSSVLAAAKATVAKVEQKMMNENHKLRDDVKRLEAIVAQQREEIARLTAENTRLRTGAGETGAAEAASASGTGSVDLPGRHGSVTSMRDRFDSSNSVASAGSGISNTSSHDNSRGGSQASIYTSNYEASNIDVFYKLHQLQSGEVEASIEPKQREYYLSDEDFMHYFKCDKAEFSKMPKWKQVNKKKALRLF